MRAPEAQPSNRLAHEVLQRLDGMYSPARWLTRQGSAAKELVREQRPQGIGQKFRRAK